MPTPFDTHHGSIANHAGASWGPQFIACLTEEPTDWLYLLGDERRIVGTSGCTVRPPQARVDKPKGIVFSDLQTSGKGVSSFYQGLK